jgi:two-component system phosphate regulon sensor histidine kinase PhoR
MANASFQKIAESEDNEGKLYWEVIRDPVLSELIQKVKEEKQNYSDEIELSGKYYNASVTFIPSEEEIVVTFHDITESRRVEQIKKDFIINVSHELRTPLTAIKGFVETIEQDAAKKHQKYLDIITRNTDRLINIVNDLLVQSELEEKYIKLEMEDVDLEKLITNICKIFEPKAQEKGLSFSIPKASGFPPTVKGDPFKLEQLFVNIIDNAVKYTEEGEITVRLSHEDRDVFITIEDTGIGIPETELPRIFERFYVVDKSRSRRLGGTGLGLSIVKHIALLHNGEVTVKSTAGQGTKVTVRLPA